MALEKKKMSEIPSDAIILTEVEALSYQHKLLSNWKQVSDVFAYKYGSVVLGGATMLSGIYLNNYFRMKFRLLHYGRVTSYLPICAVPASLSFILHRHLVVDELVLLKNEQCPICLELRASVIQSAVGCLMPLVLAPVSSIALVHRYCTTQIPYITKEPKEVYNLLKKQIKPIKNILLGIVIGHALIGSAVTYFEANSIYKVNFKLTELVKELELAGKI